MIDTARGASLLKPLKEFFGFNEFKGDQEKIIRTLLNKEDVFVIMPTGGGKSLCYQLPALMSEGTAIVVSPLIALMKNQVDAIRGFSSTTGVAHFLNSSLNKTETATVKKDVLSGKTKLLYVAPETLNKEDNISFFLEFKISFIAIDEAHCISEWGHDFRPEYRRLRSIIDKVGSVPVIALTATATPKVQNDIQKNLDMLEAKVFKSSFNRSNLYYEIRPKINVNKEIVKYVKQNAGKSGIIYCLSRKKVEEVAEVLKVNGIKAAPYHAGLDAKERTKTQDDFLMEEMDVIVATIAFGMGIDKPDVRFVIHHDISKSLEGYYQETGRVGRDGGEGNCVTFYSYSDIAKLEKFIKDKPVNEQDIGKQMLAEIAAYSETGSCRRKFLLHYFGEPFNETKCNAKCDNCHHPKPTFEAKDDVKLAINCVIESKEKHNIKDLTNIMIADNSSNAKIYKHNKLKSWGTGLSDGKDEQHWNAVFRQALVFGFFDKEVEQFGVLKITAQAKAFLKAPYSIKFHKDHDYSNADLSDDEELIAFKGKGAGAADEVLFNILKSENKAIAKQKGLPPYIIFSESSIEEMATQYPITIDELAKITGVGVGKANKFGKSVVTLIKKYVDDNQIERPTDFAIKSIVNKSGLKVFIIQNIDRKISLDDMAKNKCITLDELLTEIETIVESGTRVNIDYYINQVIDEDKQDDITECLKEQEVSDINGILKELDDDDYTEEMVRLMRIKFISDNGN